MENRNSELLVAYAAGELDVETANAVERHLAGCEACRAMAADQAAVWRVLDSWEAPPVAEDFDQRLHGRIRDEVRAPWWERVWHPFHPIPLRQAFATAAAAVLLLMASLLVERPGRIAPVAEPRAQTVRVDQVVRTLDDLELLDQFDGAPHSDHTM